jgi:nucleoside-diphosphate-sugar epimerase
MQTILGANGTVGVNLAKALAQYTNQIRLVSRTPKKVNATDELVSADLLDATQTANAVKGSEVVYLTAGLPYNTQVWQADWHRLMQNVIDACKQHNAKLVFFDNVYMYGLVSGRMTEATPFNPTSKKGEVRARIATMILDAVKSKNLTALIARAADFYGANVTTSVIDATVIQNLKKGKAAQLFGNPDAKHAYTYTPDAGSATALLGNTATAFNQTWHLPTAEAITGRAMVELLAKAFGVPAKASGMGATMVRIIGLFVPVMKEFPEMFYQYENDYLFDSSKFEKAFGVKPTSYADGATAIAEAMK